MVYGAINLHTRYSQIRVIDEAGQVLREQRVPTSRERLTQAFEGWGPLRMSWWRPGRRVSGWRRRSRGRGTRSSWPIPTTRRCMGNCGAGSERMAAVAVAVLRHRRMITGHFDFAPRDFFGFCGAAQLANIEIVVKRHRQHDRVEQMIAIGAPADDTQA